ncbi:putative N-acetyltransferase YycN [Streptomyces hundungensis]|uniref:Putative N-acetyltransferase YycN n=1 Tax=Streptomyces hundungensis TaxID=1077946 RepID=A0A387HMT6_9ACTN|nr:GNAT family N-acetyltransferase [Streptomyces hundungensis]AYG84001.1 putative N-acetyltransferase YycN [Streptomyces hundungensis]
MTTTIRPTEPLQQGADGAKSRVYDVCVNSRRVGRITITTDGWFGAAMGRIEELHIDPADRGRGRGTVAALAAEEVLRGWGCDQVRLSIPADADAALRMARALGYLEGSRTMLKQLPSTAPELAPTVTGRPMTAEEFEGWERAEVESYARSWIERGVPEERARERSAAEHRALMPEGLATAGTRFLVLEEGGSAVGTVWVAKAPAPGDGAYIYDVNVAEEHRGRGHGRSLMLLAERAALADGMDTMGLHVFADNTPALRLYESLGYRPTLFHQYKPLL